MLQSTSEYEERNFDDIQRALDIEHTVKALEAQLCYDQHSPEEVARQILKAACKFYDADWCGLIQVDLDLKIWTPFWWYNDSSEDKTTILTEEFESAEFLDRWVQAVRHGKPMIVPDAEEVKNTYPAEYDLYQRLGIRSVPWCFSGAAPCRSTCGTQSQAVHFRNEYSAAIGVCSSRCLQRQKDE